MEAMTTNELRELDALIAERVMGWTPSKRPGHKKGEFFFEGDVVWIAAGYRGSRGQKCFSPTTDPAGAMEVLKKCALKCTVLITLTKSGEALVSGAGLGEEAPTLELAIALFAKKLFE